MHRVGRRPAVVERQSRPQRHFLFAMNQWHVASLQPPHLAAMCIWEGSADWYRDMTHHGGMLSTFWENWYDMQVKTVQYGPGERGGRSRVTGELVCGPETFSDEELARTAVDFGGKSSRIRSTITVTAPARRSGTKSRCHFFPPPIGAVRDCTRAAISKASCAPHQRTNGSKRTASSTGRIFTPTTAVKLQKRFFDHFLNGENETGQAAAGAAPGPSPGEKFVERARKRVADRAHASGRSSISTPPTRASPQPRQIGRSSTLRQSAMDIPSSRRRSDRHRNHRAVGG